MAWEGKTLVSALFYALSTVKIIPVMKSTWKDKIGLFVMLTLVTVPGAVIGYVDTMDILSKWINFNSMQIFSFYIVNNVGPLQIILMYPSLGYFIFKYKYIMMDNSLDKPKHFKHFLLAVVISIIPFSMYMYMYIGWYDSWYMIVLISTYSLIQLITRVTSIFTVGVGLDQMCKRIESASTCSVSTNIIEEVISEFITMKQGLSPLLFSIFTTQSLLVISQLYLGTTDHNKWISYVLYACLELSYLAFTLEDTYSEYKNLLLQLR